MTKDELLQRERAILDEIIQYYMTRREAISARTLSKISRLSLSPTTIRNLMEDLSSAGFLTTEGVTRGRIPTQKAFAIYVAQLRPRAAQTTALAPEVPVLEEDHPARLGPVVRQLGERLAERTGLVVLTLLPPRDAYPLDWVTFGALPRGQVLVTVRTLFGDLWSKVLVSPEPIPEALLEQIGRFIGETYRGAPLETVRADIMAGEPKVLLERMPSLGAGFRMLRKAFEWDASPQQGIWGEANVFRVPEYGDPELLAHLHGALRDERFLPQAVQRGRALEGGVVSIGTELAYPGLEYSSMVAYPFGWRAWQGLVSVLGPMRMDYAAVFTDTVQTAGVLDAFLQQAVAESGFRAGPLAAQQA